MIVDANWEEVEIHEAAAADAHQQKLDEKEANDRGFCFHCGEELKNCTGYKCWIR